VSAHTHGPAEWTTVAAVAAAVYATGAALVVLLANRSRGDAVAAVLWTQIALSRLHQHAVTAATPLTISTPEEAGR
jgi:hypothetical protein